MQSQTREEKKRAGDGGQEESNGRGDGDAGLIYRDPNRKTEQDTPQYLPYC